MVVLVLIPALERPSQEDTNSSMACYMVKLCLSSKVRKSRIAIFSIKAPTTGLRSHCWRRSRIATWWVLRGLRFKPFQLDLWHIAVPCVVEGGNRLVLLHVDTGVTVRFPFFCDFSFPFRLPLLTISWEVSGCRILILFTFIKVFKFLNFFLPTTFS